MRKVAPYGSWRSPITAEMLAKGSNLPGGLTVDGEYLYWLELQPEKGGRYALYRWTRNGQTGEVIGTEFNVRTRVHEYGGGSYLVHNGEMYFSNFKDQKVYRQRPGGRPKPLTKEGMWYADCIIDEGRKRLVGVLEDHTVTGRLPSNSLATIELDGAPGRVLVSGNDFYSNPRLNPEGSKLAWLTWNFPNMPWDGTELWIGEVAKDGSIAKKRLVAGGKDESIFQPEWSPAGKLYFVSDRSGWWNIYRWAGGEAEAVHPAKAEFGRPQWSFGMSTYAFESERRIVCAFRRNGTWHVAILDATSGSLSHIRLPYSEVDSVRTTNGRAVFIAGSPTEPLSVVELDLKTLSSRVLFKPNVPRVAPGFISRPVHIQFPTTRGRKAYAFYYAPKNRDYTAPKAERPPLIVISHGGPTSATMTDLDLDIQSWTSRGFGVLDVNYGGSSGYGREYMKSLEGQWGVVDVDDCANGALYLARKGEADRNRLIIKGSSAGGYTTLAALVFKRVFGAGASYYGLSELESFTSDTHKFESRYMDRLIGPYPEKRELYRKRSPVYYVDRISCPVIFFQGLEDVIVPPNQAEMMVDSLRKRGIPVAYLSFEGEQHGFRKAETIIRAHEAELFFYSKVFGFSLPDIVEPVEIENADGLAKR